MKTIKLQVQKVEQPIGYFYITKINSDTLYEMGRADILKISEKEDQLYEGIQRELRTNKVNEISTYVESPHATFPNTIILNLNKKSLVSETENELVVRVDKDAFSIIDGQHRIEGLKKSGESFDLAVSIFVDLPIHLQSEVFVTINTEQTKVNPSIAIIQYSQDTLLTPRKFASELAISFGINKGSVWEQKIKFIGTKDELSEDGIISLKTFYTPILELIYDDKDYSRIQKQLKENNSPITISHNYNLDRYYFWGFYVNGQKEVVYKILNNYFEAMCSTFISDWEDKNSILLKTTGYNAMMLLFKDLYQKGYEKETLTIDFFKSEVKNLRVLDKTINSSNYDSSGASSSKKLYEVFYKTING